MGKKMKNSFSRILRKATDFNKGRDEYDTEDNMNAKLLLLEDKFERLGSTRQHYFEILTFIQNQLQFLVFSKIQTIT